MISVIAVIASDAPLVEVRTEPFSTAVSDARSTWKPKVHGESSADEWDVSTIGSESRVRLEPTVTDFDITTPTATADQGPKESTEIIDIGTAIGDLITETDIERPPEKTVHWEETSPGWEDATSTVHRESSATYWPMPSSELAHFESSAKGWERTQNQESSKPQSSRYIPVKVTDDPWTKNVKPPQVTGSGSPVGRQPQVTTIPSKIITDFPPPAAVTYDGITIQPTAVTRRPTVTAPDGAVTTIDKVEFQVAIGSSTLSVGTPITVNDVVVSLVTDTAGSTILHAGDLTTTLPEPTAGEVRTVAGDPLSRLSIMTSVISGTTKYVLAGQTLAPGQPVTIGDTPISIALDGDKTVLFVGERTTTLAATESDIQTITDLASVRVGTEGTSASSGSASAEPTSTRSGSSQSRNADAAFAYCAVGMAIFMVTA